MPNPVTGVGKRVLNKTDNILDIIEITMGRIREEAE